MFDHFERGLALLAAQDLGPVDPVDVGSDIKQISRVINRLEAQRARRIERFDRDRGFGPSGATSTTSWLRNNCRLSGGSADKQVRLARQLPELEATQKALENGEIGIEHALEIAVATSDLGVAAEGELLSAAHFADPVELREKAKEIRHRVDAEGMARLAQEQYRKRRLRVFNLADGMVGVDGALPPEGGVALKLCLESLVGIPAKDDERSPEQRNVDALMQLCKLQLDSGRLPSVGGRKPHLTLVVQAVDGGARLEGYGPVCRETAERLECEGSVSVMKVDGQGAALDLGRSRRLASEPQRRALAARDRHCQAPGCTWEARFCDAHHLDSWTFDGGGTAVKRMLLLCDKHHRLVHEGGWRLVERDGGRFDLAPPWDRPPD